ncbi:MAG TPA: N-acetyltransferase [Lachnospiraceae bacterium]|jgi:RimJ/RimL family protein N-acetyltransferase|nr:N-acetyltransferase [Lachnospiraceae bacterium]HBR01140.1 N-acetyltransferase [Ruminiclostridium sp.]
MADIGTKSFKLPQGILIIRSAHAPDAEELLALMLRSDYETDFLARNPGEFRITLDDERRFIKDKLSNPAEVLLTARLNGILAGTLGFTSSPLLRYLHKGSFGISILKDYWGLGIGRKLIETLFEWADTRGIVKITLEVDTLNSRAIRLYRSLGFIEEGLEIADRRLENGQFRNSLLMARFHPDYRMLP